MKKAILVILLSCVLFSSFACALIEPTEKIFSIDEYNLAITADSTFSDANADNFDLQITNSKCYISVFGYMYIDLSKGQTPIDVFDIQNEDVFSRRNEVTLIEDTKTEAFSNYTITQALHSAEYEGSKNYYATYLIDFPEEEVFAWVLITSTPSYLTKNREYLNNIVYSLTLIE